MISVFDTRNFLSFFLIVAFFYRCRGAEEFFQAFGIEFELAVISIYAVDFLLDVGKLRVAIAELLMIVPLINSYRLLQDIITLCRNNQEARADHAFN